MDATAHIAADFEPCDLRSAVARNATRTSAAQAPTGPPTRAAGEAPRGPLDRAVPPHAIRRPESTHRSAPGCCRFEPARPTRDWRRLRCAAASRRCGAESPSAESATPIAVGSTRPPSRRPGTSRPGSTRARQDGARQRQRSWGTSDEEKPAPCATGRSGHAGTLEARQPPPWPDQSSTDPLSTTWVLIALPWPAAPHLSTTLQRRQTTAVSCNVCADVSAPNAHCWPMACRTRSRSTASSTA